MSKVHKQMRSWVRGYMAANDLTQDAFAPLIHLTQKALSARLTGRTRWSLDDVVALAAQGVIPADLTPLIESAARP